MIDKKAVAEVKMAITSRSAWASSSSCRMSCVGSRPTLFWPANRALVTHTEATLFKKSHTRELRARSPDAISQRRIPDVLLASTSLRIHLFTRPVHPHNDQTTIVSINSTTQTAPEPAKMAPDYDALSDGSELTGEDSPIDDDELTSAPRTPSKKRRRIVRAMADDDEDEDEVADALDDELNDDDDDDDDEVLEDADELEDDDDYDTPSSSRRGATRTSGRKSAGSSRAAATPKRSARTSTRTAATTTPTTSTGKKSLRVKLTRTPQSAAAPTDDSPASKPSASTRRTKDASKLKWKPRSKGKSHSDSETRSAFPR